MSIKVCRFSGILLCLVVLLAGSIGCGSSTTEDAEGAAEGDAQQPAQAAQGQAQPPRQVWLAASHILIQHTGASRAIPEVTRTKEEALALATELAAKAAGGADFAQLAQENSDGPTAPKGGNLGVFPATRMVPAFAQAAALLAVGEISDPVETPFGFHVIRRDREVELVGARHILVMHTESERVPPEITRTKEEALARSQEALEKSRSGADFAQLAAEYSDGPTKVKGGDLGLFPKGVMAGAFEDAAFALEAGAISDVVETPLGFHIIMRYE